MIHNESMFLINQYTIDSLLERVEVEKNSGRVVVLTNGCFDIIHRGHIEYLEEAKRQGDFLVVALNSDDVIQEIKGVQRPFNTLMDRMSVVSALSCVDAVVSFNERTAIELVKKIEPQVYVKGGDYTLEELRKVEGGVVEAYGGRIHIARKVADRSTTTLITRILHAHKDELSL